MCRSSIVVDFQAVDMIKLLNAVRTYCCASRNGWRGCPLSTNPNYLFKAAKRYALIFIFVGKLL